MKNFSNKSLFKKTAAVFAALAFCLTLSVTVLAAAGVLQGTFADITNGFGTVVGTSYGPASDEIDVSVTVCGEALTVFAGFSDSQKPVFEAEALGISAYQIIDADGNIVKEGSSAETAEIINGQAAINIQLDGVESGSYKLVITAFSAEKKADQPLNVTGEWECTFIK